MERSALFVRVLAATTDGRTGRQSTDTEAGFNAGVSRRAREKAIRHTNGWRRRGEQTRCCRTARGAACATAAGELHSKNVHRGCCSSIEVPIIQVADRGTPRLVRFHNNLT